jgi:iron complex transport system substrate-binding protein
LSRQTGTSQVAWALDHEKVSDEDGIVGSGKPPHLFILRTEDVHMRRTALIAVMAVVVAACGVSSTTSTSMVVSTTSATDADGTSTTTVSVATTFPESGFPVRVEDDGGVVRIERRPEAIISLSSTATEMLFAIGAGSQVVAVDDQSNFPADAPMTALSGYTPNLEAILSFEPDLVVITFDPGDLVEALRTAGVPVLSYTAAFTLDDVYRQIDALGKATGNEGGAAQTNESIALGLENAVARAADAGDGVTYYHEIDATLYTVTSSTFLGEMYGLFGMVNIADPADSDGASFGYPQLSSEFIVAENPDIVFLADVLYGVSPTTVAQRPGWEIMDAVEKGAIVELDSDIASRWGPRIVELAMAIASSLENHRGG